MSSLFKDAIGEFSIKLLKRLTRGQEESVVYSTHSIFTSLGMTLLGAKGETRENMVDALGLRGLSNDQIEQGFKESNAELIKFFKEKDDEETEDPDDDGEYIGPSPRIRQANRLFIEASLPITEDFLTKTKNVFDAEAIAAPFRRDIAGVQSKMNSFVSEKTLGLIPEILKEPLDPNTVMALVNALYFQASWILRMDRRPSADRFNAHAGKSSQKAEWIGSRLHCQYRRSEELNAQLVRVPYASEDYPEALSMVFILPRKSLKKSFERWLLSDPLNWANIRASINSTEEYEVDLTFPKFKIESTWGLGNILVDLGMGAPFEVGANFDGMVAGARKLKLSDVFHGAMIEVDEFGTKAAAAAGCQDVNLCEPERVVVKIDRSFIALIILHTEESIVPLFTTVVNKL